MQVWCPPPLVPGAAVGWVGVQKGQEGLSRGGGAVVIEKALHWLAGWCLIGWRRVEVTRQKNKVVCITT